MKLGEWLKSYRKEHKLSMQDVADVCGFSKAYVGMLEKGINPTTKKPFSPTMRVFYKLANLAGQDIDSFLKMIDGDQLVTISSRYSDEEEQLVSDYRTLADTDKAFISAMVKRLMGGGSKAYSSITNGNVVKDNIVGNNSYLAGGDMVMR